jgi:YVTN family beta-propeller protein
MKSLKIAVVITVLGCALIMAPHVNASEHRLTAKVATADVGYLAWVSVGANRAQALPLGAAFSELSQQTVHISVDGGPAFMALSADGNQLYVANSYSNTLSIVDTASRQQVASIPVGGGATGVAISHDGATAYVSNYLSDTLSVVDLSARREITHISVGDQPVGIALTRDGKTAYVANRGGTFPRDPFISVVDLVTQKQVRRIEKTAFAHDIVLSADEQIVHVTEGYCAFACTVQFWTLTSIDLLTNVDSYVYLQPKPGDFTSEVVNPRGLAISPDGTMAYVTGSTSHQLYYVDLVNKTIAHSMPIGLNPWSLALSADGRRLYAANSGDSTLAVVDVGARQVIRRIPTPAGSNPRTDPNQDYITHVALAPDGKTAYVSQRDLNVVYVINADESALGPSLESQIIDYPIFTQPPGFDLSAQEYDIVASKDGSTLLVTDRKSDAVHFVDRSSMQIVASVSLGQDSDPRRIAVAPSGETAYVTGEGNGGQLHVIDLATRRKVDAFGLEAGPTGIALSPDGAMAYITCDGTDRVIVVNLTGRQVVGNIRSGLDPGSIVVTRDGTKAYVVDKGSDSVSVLNLQTRQRETVIPVGDEPAGIALSPDSTTAYVTNEKSNTLSVLDLIGLRSTTAIKVGNGPNGVALAPGGGYAFISMRGPGGDAISIVDLVNKRVAGAFQTGKTPGALVAFTPTNISTALDLAVSAPTLVGTRPGEAAAIPIAVSNVSLSPSGPITVTVTLGNGLTYISASPPVVMTGQVAQWTFIGLNALAAQPILVRAAPPADATVGQRFAFSVAVSSSDAEVTQANNGASGEVLISQAVALPIIRR